MKIRLVFVSTVDGKITRWNDPDVKKWSSDEDKDHFTRTWNEAKLIVMGSRTYEATPPKPSAKRLVVVVTRKPLFYEKDQVEGRLEFRNREPSGLVNDLELEGYREMMLVGGPQLATSFLKEQLVDELWLTLEPKLFGNGGNLITGENLDIPLQLTSIYRMNERGTLLLRYDILRQ
jgi:dihydrofolate reductase